MTRCAIGLALVLASSLALAQEELEIRIASIAPLTGALAHLGKDNENGARLALEEANAAKLRIGGRPAKFVLVAEDDQADPKVAVLVAQRMVDAKVAAIIGHLNSGTSIPAGRHYDQAGLPALSPSATNPRLTELGYKAQFRVVGRDDQQGAAIADVLAGVPRFKAFAVIDDGTAYGEQTADQVTDRLRENGIAVLLRERGGPASRDWGTVLEQLKRLNPDAIFYGGMDEGGAPFLKQARALGIGAAFVMADGGCTDSMATLAPGASEGMICTQNGIPVFAVHPSFIVAYRKRYNLNPILYAPFAYDAASMVIAAMVKADSAEPAKYLPELARLSFTGATGKIEFDAKGDRKGAEVTLFILQDRRLLPAAIVRDRKVTLMADYMKEMESLTRSGLK